MFRPSLRAVVLQSVLLATTTWLALRLALQIDSRGATLASLGALGLLLGARVLWHRPSHLVTLDDGAVRLRGEGVERSVSLDDIARVELDAGALSDGGHTLHVGYAQIMRHDGTRFAFADLSSLGQVSLRTPDARAEIHDVGDPEFLVAMLSSRAELPLELHDAREPPPPSAATQAAAPAPVTAARLALLVVAGRSLVHALLAPDTHPRVALAGVALTLAGFALARSAGRGAPAGASRAPFALAAAALTASVACALSPRWAPRELAAWSLSAALALYLPARPFAGSSLASALGRALSRGPRAQRAAVLALALVGAAVLFAAGPTLLALALIACVFEALEGFHASRRRRIIESSPVLRAMSVTELARLRARLRPFSEGTVEARSRARDYAEISLAKAPAPALSPLGVAAAAAGLVAVCATAAALLTAGGPAPLVPLQLWVR